MKLRALVPLPLLSMSLQLFLIMSEQKIEMGSRREAICYTLKAWRVSDLSLLSVLRQIKP